MEIGLTALSFGIDSASNNTESTSQEYMNTYIEIEKMEDFFRYFTFEHDALHKVITITDNSPEYSNCNILVPVTFNGCKIVDMRNTAIHEGAESDANFPKDEPDIQVDSICDALGNLNLSNASTLHNTMNTHSESSAHIADIKDTDMLNKVFYTNVLVGCDTTECHDIINEFTENDDPNSSDSDTNSLSALGFDMSSKQSEQPFIAGALGGWDPQSQYRRFPSHVHP